MGKDLRCSAATVVVWRGHAAHNGIKLIRTELSTVVNRLQLAQATGA